MIDNAFAFCPVRLFCCGPNPSLCETFFFTHHPTRFFEPPKLRKRKKCTNYHSNVYISPALKQFMPKMVMVMVMVARTVCLLARPLSELPVSRITETPLRLSLANSSGLGHPTKNKVGHILIKE